MLNFTRAKTNLQRDQVDASKCLTCWGWATQVSGDYGQADCPLKLHRGDEKTTTRKSKKLLQSLSDVRDGLDMNRLYQADNPLNSVLQ